MQALITWVGTRPERRRQGWAEGVLIRVLADLGASGIDCVQLQAVEAAQTLYTRRGFQAVSPCSSGPIKELVETDGLRCRRALGILDWIFAVAPYLVLWICFRLNIWRSFAVYAIIEMLDVAHP